LKTFFFVVFLYLAISCGSKSVHIDLPDNQLYFPAEGGSTVYSYTTWLSFAGVYINGEHRFSESVYVDSVYIGLEIDDWLRILEGDRVGFTMKEKVIEVSLNSSNQPRAAEIRFAIPGSHPKDCELYVYQKGTAH